MNELKAVRDFEIFSELLAKTAPYMTPLISKNQDRFGARWAEDFGESLARVFDGDRERIGKAVKGYVNFAIEAVMLQRKFQEEKRYDVESYEHACEKVYGDRDYMFEYYLPANWLIHFLWPHQYSQLQYFREHFLPEVAAGGNACAFCDIGVGSGFFSRVLLDSCPRAMGSGFDISRHSLDYARDYIERFGHTGRWLGFERDIVKDTPGQQWDYALSVEILEHLPDPVVFLKAVRAMLKPGGRAFISAALTAPQRDHIYLYRHGREVGEHLVQAGFNILDTRTFQAFEPRGTETVPELAVFIVD